MPGRPDGSRNQSWSLGRNLRDRDETLTLRDRDFEQKLETRPRLKRSETEARPGPAIGGSGGTSYPGPGLGGPRKVQVSALSFGIAPSHRNQTCLPQKYQSARSVLIIGCYFCYTAFTASNSDRLD